MGNRMTEGRYADLKKILEERKNEILGEVQEGIRSTRLEGNSGSSKGVLDAVESSEDDIQEDIEFALIQMKTETLKKINEAIKRLEEGTYGYCIDCVEEISPQRLRALPFAVRCKDCEVIREVEIQRERQASQRRGRRDWLF
jgi:DnaK suppressor protein